MTGLLAGCGPTTSCAGWRPIFLDPGYQNRWTADEKRQVLDHNEHGEKAGCW